MTHLEVVALGDFVACVFSVSFACLVISSLLSSVASPIGARWVVLLHEMQRQRAA